MPEIVSEMTSSGPRTGGTPAAGANARPVISQSITVGSVGSLARSSSSAPTGDSGEPGSAGVSNTIDNPITQGGRPARTMSETVRAALARLDASASPTPSNEQAAGEAPSTSAAPGSAPAPATPAAPAAPEAKPQPADDHRAELERVTARNRDLVAELERAKAGAGKRDLTSREKAMQAAEQQYFTGQSGAIDAVRTFLASVLGIEDPKHADVDAELSGLYQDLTSRELGVSVDPAQSAKREAARTRQLLARSERERKAVQDAAGKPTPEDPEAKLVTEHTTLIGNRLSQRQADGKTVGDAYPATMQLAERFYGLKPEATLLRVIREGFVTGEFDPHRPNEELIDQALKKSETHFRNLYQVLAGAFGGASTPASTATPNTSDASANKDAGQRQAPRPITNASASVAPATLPAKPETQSKTPTYRSETERRKALLNKRFGDK